MSLENARSVLLTLSDEPLGLDSVGRLAVAALTGAAAASGGASPAELLEALLQMRDAMVGSSHGGNAVQQASLQWVQGAAAVVLLRQLAGAQGSGEQANSRAAAAGAAVEQLLLPALANVGSDTTERQQALAAATAEAVAAFRCWGLAGQLVQAATASPLVMQADTLAGGSQQQQQLQHLPSLPETMGQLSAEQRMHLAAAVLQEALKAQASEGAQQAEQALRAVLQQAAEHTLPAVLQLLVAKQPRQARGSKASTQQQRAAAAAARSAARQLLAAALQAACAVQQQGPAMQQLWAACRWEPLQRRGCMPRRLPYRLACPGNARCWACPCLSTPRSRRPCINHTPMHTTPTQPSLGSFHRSPASSTPAWTSNIPFAGSCWGRAWPSTPAGPRSAGPVLRHAAAAGRQQHTARCSHGGAARGRALLAPAAPVPG